VSELAEPCRDCRAPLVPGQRYCLYCGARRPDARLEFMDVLTQDRVAPAPAGAVTTETTTVLREPGVNGWLRQNSPVLALTGLILGTLLIGLLIGHWATHGGGGGSPAPARAAAPQVIRVDASGGAPSTTAADTTSTAAGDDTKTASSAKQQPKAKADKAAAPADAVSADSLGSGEAKQKAIEKAAKSGQPISTGGGGKLPPTDDKAPAGGAGFETIG
jgi:hypothetical protein